MNKISAVENKTKKCALCKEERPVDQFYRDKYAKDGRCSRCKACVKTIRDYEFNKKAYQKEKARGKAKIRTRNNYNRPRLLARGAARNAVASGKIKRQPCEVCNEPKTEMHHDDYSKPLEVRHLCLKHHKELHREQQWLETQGDS